MTNTPFMRKKLRAGTALQALALLGAGVVASAALVAPASAQDFTTISATGRVQGTDAQPIAGATVSITSNDQGFTRTATTDSNGAYRIPQIPAGSYTFTVSATGFDSFTDANVDLTRTATGNTFTLASTGAASGDIVVTAGRTQVADFEQTTTGAVINVSDLANRVPVARDLTSVIRLTPGSASGDSAFGNLPSVNGASVAENQYFVNGLNVTDFRNFLGSNQVPFEFYDTIDVKDGGYQAEYGRATGGFVSATTKSGTNEFHAGAIVTWEPDELASDAPNTLTADNDADYSSDLRADFYISGPIIKDHLFFYGLYESRNVKSGGGGLTSRQYTTSRTTSPFFAGKVDAVITDGQRLEFTYFRTTGVTRNVINAYDPDTNKLGAYGSSYLGEYGGENYVGRYTGSFTDWFTISAAYGKSNNRENSPSTEPDAPLVVDNRTSPATYPPGSNLGYFQTFNEDQREFYRADADIYVHLLGSHHFRFGYDRENLSTTGLTNYAGGRYYNIYNSTSVGPYVIAREFVNGGTFKTRNEAFYAEDSWSLLNDRLTLQLGIRNDRFENDNIDGVTYYKSGNQWGPRVNFAFDPFGDKRTKIYGSFGRYFLPIAANTNERLGGAEYDVDSYYTFAGFDANNVPILGAPIPQGNCIRPDPVFNVKNNCYVRSDGTTADTASTVSQTLKPQSEDEYILGFEQKIGQRWTIGVYGTYRTLNRGLEDSAIDAAARRYCEAQPDPNNPGHNFSAADCSYIYGGFSQYVLNNPGDSITTQLAGYNNLGLPDGTHPIVTFTADDLGYPKIKRKYEAITFKFDREYDGVWSLSGSYTFSKAIGNYEGGVQSENGQTDTGLTTGFDQPELEFGDYGYLPNDHRHNFKIYGSYKVLDWLELGANLDVQSPRHFGCIGLLPPGLTGFSDIVNLGYGASSRYCPYKDGSVAATDPDGDGDFGSSNPVVQVRRGTGPKSDWLTNLDLTAAVTIPTDAFQAVLRFDVFNVFNSHAVTDIQEYGTFDKVTVDPASGLYTSGVRSDYGAPTGYQQPRYARVQLQLRF